MNVEHASIRLLKHLNKVKVDQPPSRGNVCSKLALSQDELSILETYLYDERLVNLTKETLSITPKGKAWLEQKIKEEKEEIYKDVFDDYDFALFKFLNKDDGVQLADFPEIFITQVPIKGHLPKGNMSQYLYNKREYIDGQNERCYKLNEEGQALLRKKINERKFIAMPSEYAVFKFFYKENQPISLDRLLKKFGQNDSFLIPINKLVDEDYLEEYQNLGDVWVITDEGRQEFERIERNKSPQPTTINNQTIEKNYGTAAQNSDFKKAAITTNFNSKDGNKKSSWVVKIWHYITNNPLVAGILATLLATFIMIYFFGHQP
jgi:DNA-binding PadR family transcriptional regulator